MKSLDGEGDKDLTPLEELADALLEAHRHAVADGDPRLKQLVEDTLAYVGRRLAQAVVMESGVATADGPPFS